MPSDRYGQRGVSADKAEVHKAIKHLDKGLFPNAFCKILEDISGNDPDYCNIMHADTAGTKTSLAYLYYKDTGDASVFELIAQDAIVMNLDDMACAGAIGPIIISSTIGRNKNRIPGEIIEAVINGTSRFIRTMEREGVEIKLAGGETADVGDIVRTIDVGITAFARLKKQNVQDINIQPGNVIVGIASYGQAKYEGDYNSGIASNGLTAARHETLSYEYAKNYPESFDPNIPEDLVFTGSKKLTDVEAETQKSVGHLLLSPTRTFLPVLKDLFGLYRPKISGIIHNTGGAHSKVLNFIHDLEIVKNNLFSPPPVFRLIQAESGMPWNEMYKVFNMGTRLEVFTDKETANGVIDIAHSYNIDAQIIGYVNTATAKKVKLETEYGSFQYQ